MSLWSFEGGRDAPAAFTISGGHSGGGTPLPIPNRAVKPASADGTRRVTSRESRTPPVIFPKDRLGRSFVFKEPSSQPGPLAPVPSLAGAAAWSRRELLQARGWPSQRRPLRSRFDRGAPASGKARPEAAPDGRRNGGKTAALPAHASRMGGVVRTTNDRRAGTVRRRPRRG